MEINKIYNENCLDTMKRMTDNYIDLIVTSPPYDDLRDYKGYSFPFEEVAKELYRITKEGGVVVWIVNDSVKDGSETLTSFKQALYFKEVCGFKVHDTMIYQKHNFSNPSSNRYHQIFEYMFILSKDLPKTFNPIKDRKNVFHGKSEWGSWGKNNTRQKDGTLLESKKKENKEYGMRYNIWKVNTKNGVFIEEYIRQHPAIFPEELCKDNILSWSNENDLIYDPFMGSGTTAISCLQLNRNFIGSEISEEYCNISLNRIKSHNYNYVF